ncbi:hypothetical protein [Flavobacterium terrae]|uniref:Outer membrane protein beta-barrel domain-containing protein n=1 Tax=Flavobacterium terrae TaxID=415425 RepID=A0A1M6CZS9_9FLAO|nr:hypothetical protein [Flavobacterium terrae]SHI66479.1 hypothetical protein SAMN05444363_1180 [Flavobacterium terrae]
MNLFKTNLLLLVFFLCSMPNYGQKKVGDIRLGYGFSGGVPIKDHVFAAGIDGRIQYDITLKSSLIGTTGYTHYFSSTVSDIAYIPAKAGFKSHIGDQIYILGELGAAFSTTGEGVSFLWNPGVGVATKHIDISLRYENVGNFNTGQLALRLAYGYKL